MVGHNITKWGGPGLKSVIIALRGRWLSNQNRQYCSICSICTCTLNISPMANLTLLLRLRSERCARDVSISSKRVRFESDWYIMCVTEKKKSFTSKVHKIISEIVRWLYRSTLVEVISTISSANWPLGSGIMGPFKWTGNHTYLGLNNNWGMQSKNVFKMCEGISFSSFSVMELDVIVQKKYFPCITLLNFGYSVPHITGEPGGWGGN